MLLFGKSKTIQEIVGSDINDEHFELINKWKSIYSGSANAWTKERVHTINSGKKPRKLHSLNMAKVASEELAKIIFSEKVEINISDEELNEYIQDVLKDNRFDKVFQSEVEQMLALGGLVLKVFPKKKYDGTYKLQINYITPDCFIPTAFENGEVTEAVFLNVTKKGDKEYCLFESHKWVVVKGENGPERELEITNKLYMSEKNGNELKQVPLETLYNDLKEKVYIKGLSSQLFAYIKPNVANNFDVGSPLGISIFANAEDTLYALDVAFDSFIREFKMGKRRIIVPTSAIRTAVDPMNPGTMHRYFDADDEVYEAMNMEDKKIIDNTVGLRIDEHVSAINALLNLFSMQIGFSSGTFVFDGVSVKTATEIISEKSKTYQTKQSNEDLIEEALGKFIMTLGEVAELYEVFSTPDEDYEVVFSWDDSIIRDKDSETAHYLNLMNNQLVSKKFALMKIMDITEEQAIEMLNEIKEEQTTFNPSMEDILLGDDNLEGLIGKPEGPQV